MVCVYTQVKNGVKMNSMLSTDQDYNLWVLLRQTRDAMVKARERELEKYGISSIQAAVLFTIQAIGAEATPAEISRRLVREPHSVSGLLNRMERQGLITRVKDLPKRNMVRVVMTDKGREAYEQSTKRLSMHEIMSVLSEAERNQMWGYLERLRDKAMKLAGIGYELPFPPHWSDADEELS
jgi:MarR family transcriptional regulator, organic hydroperoxide resistance regulator